MPRKKKVVVKQPKYKVANVPDAQLEMLCMTCGLRLREKVMIGNLSVLPQVCPTCRTNLQPSVIVCPTCTTAVNLGANRICPYCGERLRDKKFPREADGQL